MPPSDSEHEHTIDCLVQIGSEIGCRYEASKKPMTESEADARAKALWGPKGFASDRGGGRVAVGYLERGSFGSPRTVVKGTGKTWEEAFSLKETEPSHPAPSSTGCPPNVSKEQCEIIKRMAASASGRIVRLAGGFWTTYETKMRKPGVPEWSTAVQSIRAMERKGLVKRTHDRDEWKDDRVLTEAGLQIARSLGYKSDSSF